MKLNILIFLVLSQIIRINAQFENSNLQDECLTDFLHRRSMKNDSSYKSNFKSNQKLLYKEATSSKQGSTILTVPVVFHVMHLGETEGTETNISYEQILSALESMNEAYRGNAPYSSSGVDLQIEFCMAAQDPSGNPTNGVNRIDASGTSDYSTNGLTTSGTDNELSIKALSIWPNTDYYNIWIVSEINGNDAGSGTQGFAYFPGAGSTRDGTVIMYNSIGYDPNGSRCFNVKSYTNLNTTLIHELGHAFGLYHTFEGDNDGTTCPSETDCSIEGDLCCDTPPHDRTSGCPTSGNNACGTPWSGHMNNFMDYSSSSCQTEFTEDQKTRARGLLSIVRASLLSSSACTPVSVPDCDFATECSSKTGCIGSSIQFYDLSTHNPTSWSWTFSGGTPATSSDQNPLITYNIAGTYPVSLISSNSSGDGTLETKTSYITIYDSPTTACTTGLQNSGYYGYALSNMTFGNINFSSSPSTNGYIDNSCSSNTCVTEGQTYNLSLIVDNHGSQEGQYAVYIDYNDNGTLNDADETVFSGTTVSESGTQTITGTVTIPTNANESELLRMRVINDQFNLSGPCDNLWTGEAEDYGIYISPEINISSQPSDAILCSGANTVFSVTSTGSQTFQWQEDNGSGFTDISNSEIYSGTTTANLTITGVSFGMDSYNYRCVLSNGCDQSLNSNPASINLNSIISGADTQTACNSYTWIDGVTYTNTNNSATFNIPGGAANGCDSLVTLNLTITNSVTGIDTQTQCDSYTWIDGVTYSASNNSATFNISGGATNGCDSLVNLDLTINSVTDIGTSTSGITIEANNSNASYVWLECDNNFSVITGETNQNYTALEHGNYAVELTENSCIDTSACVNINSVGIIENSFMDNFTLFPNPTNGNFSIKFESPQKLVQIRVMSISGKLISDKIYKSINVINHQINEPKGVYIVEVSDMENQRSLIRLIKR